MKKYLITILFLVALIGFANFVFASDTNGTINSGYKNAWAENAGWINFGCTNCNVQITDSALTGYAWSDRYGWIKLNPTNGGVFNDAQGNLSGAGWGTNVGWVDFSSVKINTSGQFTGSATGTVVGSVNFDCTHCTVLTDWRPASTRTPAPTNNLPGGGNYQPTMETPASGFSVSINNSAKTTNSASVTLTLNGGGQAVSILVSNYSDFKDASKEVYAVQKPWVLTQGDGSKTVYVEFIDKDGKYSSAVSASIILSTKTPDIKIVGMKSIYLPTEDVLISGQTDDNAQIIFGWDNKYGMSKADSLGNWTVNLGQISEGSHALSIEAKNETGNSRTISTNISVQKPEAVIPVKPSSGGQTTTTPQIVTVPKEVPLALQGVWNLLPMGRGNFQK